MDLSAKITNSVYLYFESSGEVAGDYLEQAQIPAHVGLDSERWLDAHKVEFFLSTLAKKHSNFYPKDVALKAPEIRGWGLLDQVLRIIQSSSEIYEDPKNFLSYFIDGSIKIDWIEKKDKISSFKINLSTDEFPLVTEYLSGALEVVSRFTGGESSVVSWVGNTVSIDWSKKQENIFKSEEPKNFKPEVFKEAVAIIQKQQEKLATFKVGEGKDLVYSDSSEIIEDLKILEDYFLRSRQLISLLKAESGNKKWFKEAVKRLNWNELQGLHSQKIIKIKNLLNKEEKNELQQDDLKLF